MTAEAALTRVADLTGPAPDPPVALDVGGRLLTCARWLRVVPGKRLVAEATWGLSLIHI